MILGGLDIGTTGCKLSLYDQSGSFISNAYREYESIRTNCVQEIDANAVWEAVEQVINESCASGKIDAIGVTSFGESFVLLDNQDNVLMPSMLYTDKRGNDECESLYIENIEEVTGLKPHGMYSLPKLMWIKKHMPQVYSKTDKIFLFEDFIVYKLTGKRQIDYSLACRTMGFDIKNKCWCKELFSIVGIDISKMSLPVASGTIAGRITAEGLNCSDTVIVNGCHDQLAALLGAGILEVGDAIDGTGTVECVTPVFENIPTQKSFYSKGYTVVPHLLEGKYICYVFSFTGGAALKWYKDNYLPDQSYSEADSNIPDSPTDILIMPHFAGAATPYMDENSKAVFLGITLGTNKYDLYKAIMEGVTYEMLLNINHLDDSGIEIKKLYATGGGAKSNAWLQIKADILNREITALDAPEAGAVGSVMLAGIATGAYTDIYDARNVLVKEKETFYPNKERNAFYMKQYEKYKRIYESTWYIM